MARPIVLIHGMWCSARNWDKVVEGLRARGHACHVPSLPFHQAGQEDAPVGAVSFAEYRRFLEADIRAQNFDQAPVLIGHSMGGLLAQQLAATLDPFLIVLLTPAAPAGINGLRWCNFVAFFRAMMRWEFWNKAHKPAPARAAASLYNGVPAERHAQIYSTLVPESGRVLFELGFWYLDSGHAARVDARSVRCPVYVVSAGRDRLTPAAVVRKVAQLYPQAALRHYPQRGHWVIDDEDTEVMVQDIANWIQAQDQRAEQMHKMKRLDRQFTHG